MPAGPAPTMANRSLVMGVLFPFPGTVWRSRSLFCSWGAGSAAAIGDGVGEARQRLAHRAARQRRERLHRRLRPFVREGPGAVRGVVVAQLFELAVEDAGVRPVGDLRDAVV